MNKKEIIRFFDSLAPTWDDGMVIDDRKTAFLMDRAGIRARCTVLDVACGTGVLFPYYLERDVSRVIGVDISPGMIRIAGSKLRDPRVEVLCGDIETLPVLMRCDCCMVYNAFPHFSDPSRLIARLALWVRPGGRLTVAHSMGLEALRNHHRGRAESVSREMLPPEALGALMAPWFDVDTQIADEEKYVVSGVRRPEEALS